MGVGTRHTSAGSPSGPGYLRAGRDSAGIVALPHLQDSPHATAEMATNTRPAIATCTALVLAAVAVGVLATLSPSTRSISHHADAQSTQTQARSEALGSGHSGGLSILEGYSALISFHGGSSSEDVNEVYVYHLASGKLHDTLMKKHAVKQGHARNLRGLEYDPDRNVLYVAQAYKHDGCIYTLDLNKKEPEAYRLYEQDGELHTYGLALANKRRWLLTSNQDTGDVSLHDSRDGKVLAYPYVTLSHKDASPRGIAVDEERRVMFLAERYAYKVSCWSLDFDDATKRPKEKLFEIDVDHPIGVTYDAKSRRLFVASDADDKEQANVRRFHIDRVDKAPKIEAVYKPHKDDELAHPTGIELVYLRRSDEEVFGGEGGAVVLVLGQKKRALYAFDALTTKYLGKVIEDFPDDPEDLLVLRNDLAEVL